MQDLVNKGYAARIPEEEVDRRDGRVWYLPHHPVINPNKDKPRTVFDCAAEHRGTFLNDRVLQGSDKQADRSVVAVQAPSRGDHGGHRGDVPPG